MNHRIRILFSILIVLTAGVLFISGIGWAKLLLDDRLEGLTASLEGQGFTVQEGVLTKFDLVPLCCAGKTQTCNANNAGAPYMTLELPDAPDQTVEDALPWGFRIAENEAIIIVGQTPPPAAYFSYQPFEIVSYSEKDQTPKTTFLPLGDSVNNLTVHTNAPASQPFNREVILIVTPDRMVESRVRAALREAGYTDGIFHTLVIPGAITDLGWEENSTEFVFLHRIFLPQPGEEDALQEYLDTSQTALRVTLEQAELLDPLPVGDLRVRGTGTTEMDLMPAVEQLRAAILDEYSDYETEELTTSVWLSDGFDGMQREVNLYGPTRDALYLRSDPTFQLSDDAEDFVIVYGVNHEASGKATYANMSIYADPEVVLGVAGENSHVFAGSARDYLPDHPQADLLYAWKISRNCGDDPHCLEVKLEGCEKIDLDDLPELWMAFRAYLEPETHVGPAFTEVIYDQAIHFSKGQ